MTLWELKPQQTAIILSTQSALDVWRLDSLGFHPNAEVLCLQTTLFNGPKVYQVGEQIVSLSHEVASHILIEAVAKGQP